MKSSIRAGCAILVGALLIMTGRDASADGPTVSAPMLLWPDGPPGLAKDSPALKPTITVYRPSPEKATGSVIVVCPGGGYGGHADHEGRPIAEWLNGLGITAVVLKYRLAPHSHHPEMLQDAARAIRTVRANADAWKIDPKRVGVLGFSAGGHLASTIATHFDAGDPNATDPIDRQSSRPDRAILIYPVISMNPPYTHGGSRRNLIGANPSKELSDSLSNELQVTKDTPPTFLAHTDEDKAVSAENPLLFALALRREKVPVELHLFEKGQHGLGLGREGFAFSEWPKLCEKWLDGQGFLKKN
jgi:acetyl esterase/lipase